ncbi:hypothetical protein G4177_11035 [Corallococcus sp. ZKHCc1 1396]|uniref:Uncharacterized protein n=1 Tax=Corallococcus soli TaxID=2710757 RepID=A0ABR9PL98_9BACT|nr:hypothetical protein [Corallococcus soli]MBE4748696.1 hypothetical protein [Corallococcus soli]
MAGRKHRTRGDAMYRMEAWIQGDGAMWALGSNGGPEVRTVEGAGEEEAQGEPFDFEESDLELVASY